MLTTFGLNRLLNDPIRSLSLGQQQRLNALIAILNKPEFVLLDELTTGLDIATQQDILNFLQQYIKKTKTTVLMASHNMREIELLCNRLVLLRNGNIIIDSTIDSILKKYKTLENFLRRYMQ